MSDVRREGRSTVVIVLAPAFPSLNWSGLHKGFKALQKEYPESKWLQLEFVKLDAQSKEAQTN